MEAIPLVDFDPYDWQIHEDPYPTYSRLREEAPVYYSEKRDFWALSRHGDVLAGFRDPVRLSNAHGVSLERDVLEARTVMSFLGMDPPDHGRLRSLVSSAFTPRRVRALEPHIRKLADTYIDAFIEAGHCEFIDDFAGALPMDVISEMLGVPRPDRGELRKLADLVVHREPDNPEVPEAGMQAAAKMLRYFADHVIAARKEPKDDLTGALILAEVEGDQLVDPEIISFLFLMIIAGNETTTKLLGNALYWLGRNPDERAKVDANPGLIPAWAEETLRYDASSQLLARTATCDIPLEGRLIPEGARVALLIGSGNRDEQVFENAARFQVERNTTQSLAFGQGTHFCLGASLARLETRIALEQVQARLGGWSVREDQLERVHSSNVRGFARFPIDFPPSAPTKGR